MFSFFRRKKRPAAPAIPPPVPPAPDLRPAPEPVPSGTAGENPEIAALRARSPEDLCGVAPGMGREEIHATLARLFRRHNRAASSLDDQLRAEAEIMLEAIVEIRRRYLEPDEIHGRDGP